MQDYPTTGEAFNAGFTEGSTANIDRCLDLEQKVAKLTEALQQYADEESWAGNVFTGQGTSGAYDHKGELIATPAPFAIAKDALGLL